MNKIVIVLCTLLFFSGGLTIGAHTGVENDYHIMQTITFAQPSFSQKEDCSIIHIDNIDSMLIEPGKPLLPSYEKTYIFPFGTRITNVDIDIQESQFTRINRDIEYVPMPVSSRYQPHPEMNRFDNGSAVYPEQWFEYRVGSGIAGLERNVFLTLSIYPVRYHKENNQLEYIDSVTIDVSYQRQPMNTFSNNETYTFLILSAPEFSSNLISLVDHKIITQNLSTKLVTTNDIYNGNYFETMGRDNPEKIKYFIKNAIEQWDTKYVMFVGGADQFPTRDVHVFLQTDTYQDDEIFVSDLYYADIYDGDGNFSCWDSNGNDVFGEYDWNDNFDEIDLYPDVHFGRLAATTSESVDAVVNKIISYESNEAWTKDWFNTMVVIGGDTFPDDPEGISEGEYMNQACLDYMDGFIPDKIWDSNKRLSGISPSGVDNINNGIENGCGFLDWAGHGSTNVWTTYPYKGSRQSLPTPWGAYYNYQIMNLKNGDMLPIVVTGACSVGKFNTNPNCFTWSFVKNPDGGGIGSFGGSGLVWGYWGSYVTLGLSGKLHVGYYKAFAEGAYTFGEMHTDTLNDYISSNMNGFDYKTLKQFIPFGDPSLMIRGESLPPEKPFLYGPSSGKIHEEQTFIAVATDPDNDKISYLFDWGDGTFSPWIGPANSEVEVKTTHVWEEQGEYQVRVLARDDRGVLSEWSDFLPVTMPYHRGISLNHFIEWIRNNLPILFPFLK